MSGCGCLFLGILILLCVGVVILLCSPPVGGPSPPGFEGGDAQGLWFCVSSICSVLVVYVALPAR